MEEEQHKQEPSAVSLTCSRKDSNRGVGGLHLHDQFLEVSVEMLYVAAMKKPSLRLARGGRV